MSIVRSSETFFQFFIFYWKNPRQWGFRWRDGKRWKTFGKNDGKRWKRYFWAQPPKSEKIEFLHQKNYEIHENAVCSIFKGLRSKTALQSYSSTTNIPFTNFPLFLKIKKNFASELLFQLPHDLPIFFQFLKFSEIRTGHRPLFKSSSRKP